MDTLGVDAREPESGATGTALRGLVSAIERRWHARGLTGPPDAFFLGAHRHRLIAALERGLLDYVAVLHWPTLHRLSPALREAGLDGWRAAVALSLPAALMSGVTGEILDGLARPTSPRAPSVLFGRVTRPTGGQVIFRSQLLTISEGDFRTPPLELHSWLARHTPAAIRAMLLGRVIKGRPDLCSDARQVLVTHATRHLSRLLPEAASAEQARLLLRLAFYRLAHPALAKSILRRVRVVDFSRRTTRIAAPARPHG